MVKQTSQQLSKFERLAARSSYEMVYRCGAKIRGRCVYFYFLANGLPYARLGVTASKKTGHPVARNRIKRRLREVFRRNKKQLAGVDVVINARRCVNATPYNDLDRDFKEAIKKWVYGSNLISREPSSV